MELARSVPPQLKIPLRSVVCKVECLQWKHVNIAVRAGVKDVHVRVKRNM
jgi:hypothetical protein